MGQGNLLGDYLRARRELVQPTSVGLTAHGTRRVAGLRREEVAMLAGISSDYYLRLEQGRDRNPSSQVLDSLARVLQLDQASTDYLVSLVTPRARPRRRRIRRETVPAGTLQLIETLTLPAYVFGRYTDVLASNRLAQALSPNLRVGNNSLRAVFLDPAERALCADWERNTALLVAVFRHSVGTDVDDPYVVELVGELSLSSERFRQLWARRDIAQPRSFEVRLCHPQVGDLVLNLEKLAITGTDGQHLAIYNAAPGTDSAEKLALLATLTSSGETTVRYTDTRRDVD
ncbi:helix-turn-helix domain-containing protein [Mycobacteroides abscessus]|uniref:helix-turn-helix domain-containing protein n=1 Tax=Mycobacteroides abscessus TaxID=36809 RepID=UPI000C262267|nr:helix-turn-helix transcriptional regulator [Mycobacteroides abscessus]